MTHITLFKKFDKTIVKASIYDRDLEIMINEGWLRTEQEAVDSKTDVKPVTTKKSDK